MALGFSLHFYIVDFIQKIFLYIYFPYDPVSILFEKNIKITILSLITEVM